MTCFAPLTGYFAAKVNESGKRGIVFDKRKSWSGVPLPIPCNKCIGCRQGHAKMWSIRCMHEKQMHDVSSFLTLTYDDDHLPAGGTLVKRDLQLFMKRLRRYDGDNGIRFYACGEYGSTLYRPHYHVLLFNRDFEDKRKVKLSGSGEPLFQSEVLRTLWSYGDHWIGACTPQSCAYVARYVLKKAGQEIIPYGCESEFTVMSRRPGIGATWFAKYHEGVYDWDNVVFGGVEARPPRYYDLKFAELQPEKFASLKRRRRRLAVMNRADSTKARLRVREAFQLKKEAFFSKRGF